MSLRIGRSSLLKRAAPEPTVVAEPAPGADIGRSFLDTFEAIGQGSFWTVDAAGLLTYLSTHAKTDVLGELDPVRRRKFWATIDPESQILATGTSRPEADLGAWQVWRVQDGDFQPEAPP